MKSLDWDEKGIRIGGKFLSNLRFADDIVIFSRRTCEAEVMINEINEAGMTIRLCINRKKTQFMKNPWWEGEKIELDGSLIAETTSCVYLGRSMNMENSMKEELDRSRRAAWAAFGPFNEDTDQLKNPKVRAHLFDSMVLPALCYAAEMSVDTSTTSRIVRTTHRALERCLFKYNRHFQYLAGMRSSDLHNLSHLQDPLQYTSTAKHRWVDHIMRKTDDRCTKRTIEWTPRECKCPQDDHLHVGRTCS